MTNGSVATAAEDGNAATAASSMTNCSVASGSQSGAVRQVMLTYKGGQQTILVPPTAPVVTLQPVQGTPGGALTVRTDNYGAFALSSLAAGAYTVRVSKVGFLPTEYGQKRWNAAGTPIALTADGSAVAAFRLPRYGAIKGTVVDENDVGLVAHRVAAYRDSQPPVLVTSTLSDDRGVYRLSGLDPGTYFVRTGAVQNEGVDYLPTFAKETLRVEEAHMVAVAVDEESASVNGRPALDAAAGRPP